MRLTAASAHKVTAGEQTGRRVRRRAARTLQEACAELARRYARAVDGADGDAVDSVFTELPDRRKAALATVAAVDTWRATGRKAAVARRNPAARIAPVATACALRRGIAPLSRALGLRRCRPDCELHGDRQWQVGVGIRADARTPRLAARGPGVAALARSAPAEAQRGREEPRERRFRRTRFREASKRVKERLWRERQARVSANFFARGAEARMLGVDDLLDDGKAQQQRSAAEDLEAHGRAN